MIEINFVHGRCSSVPFDKKIFDGLDNTVVHVISDETNYKTTCVAICSYISKTVRQKVFPCGVLDYEETPDLIKMTLHVRFY